MSEWISAAAAEWSDTSDGTGRSYNTSSSSSQRRHKHHRRQISAYRVDISSGVTLSWRNISCFAAEIGKGWCGRTRETGRYKQLLYEVSGVVEPGTLLAILGASGAGKSTLLNILTCRNLGNLHVDGQVKANGVDMGANIKSVSAYVQQDDIFLGRLTVREHLVFNATLRMGRAYSTEEQNIRIDEVMEDLGLDRIANETICINRSGQKGYSLSGSELKMLSIASELLTDPALIFCDEPTTGLDAMMAAHVIKLLQKLARRGKTILCTIHQPASHILQYFNKLLLLAEGRLAFHGTIQRALDFFSDSGLASPSNYNPADHFIHTLAVRPGIEAECIEKIVYIAARFQAEPEFKKEKKMIKAIDKMAGDPEFETVMTATSQSTPYRATWWNQMKINTWKLTVDQIRDPAVMFTRVLQNFVICSFMCILYFQQNYDQVGVTNINGAIFRIIMNVTSLGFIQLSTFMRQVNVFYRDHHNGLYNTTAFFVAENLSELPIFFIFVSTTVLLMYFLIGFYPGLQEFLTMFIVLVLVYHFSASLNSYLLGIICGRFDIAITLAQPIRLTFMLLGGFLLNDASIPIWLSWIKYLSWHRYSYQILMVNQWSKVTSIECETGKTSQCFNNGEDVLIFLNFGDINGVWINYVLLVVIAFGYRLLALLVLWFKSRERKRN